MWRHARCWAWLSTSDCFDDGYLYLFVAVIGWTFVGACWTSALTWRPNVEAVDLDGGSLLSRWASRWLYRRYRPEPLDLVLFVVSGRRACGVGNLRARWRWWFLTHRRANVLSRQPIGTDGGDPPWRPHRDDHSSALVSPKETLDSARDRTRRSSLCCWPLRDSSWMFCRREGAVEGVGGWRWWASGQPGLWRTGEWDFGYSLLRVKTLHQPRLTMALSVAVLLVWRHRCGAPHLPCRCLICSPHWPCPFSVFD
jgi:hypothetical protein